MSHDGASGGQEGQSSGHAGGQEGQHSGHTGGFGDFSGADILGSNLQNISWSTLFEGLKINSGVRFVVVFTAFISWLYVIYWIRHHEPFSNQVIGVSAPRTSTSDADRSILGRITKVFPFQTPAIANSSFYAPTPGGAEPIPQSNFVLGGYNKNFGEAIRGRAQTATYAGPGQALSAPLIAPSEQGFDPRFGSPARP